MNLIIIAACFAVCLVTGVKGQVVGASCSSGFTNQFPDPSDCSKYFKCHRGVYADYKCPVGLVFSTETTGCDWPDKVTTGCTVPTTSLDSSVNPLQFPADICPIQPCSKTLNYLLPNYNKPGNSDFYFCKDGKIYEQTCGTSSGTIGYPYFNVLRNSCEKERSKDSLY